MWFIFSIRSTVSQDFAKSEMNNTTVFAHAFNSTGPAFMTFFHASYRKSWLIWLTCVLITSFFGVLANTLLLLTSLLYREIRQTSSCPLIVHCIILDLYLSAVVAPVNCILAYLGPKQYLPPQFCRFFGLGFYSIYGVHVWAACVLAFQRLVATFSPHQYDRFTTRKAMIVMIALPWLLTIVTNLFPIFEIGTKVEKATFAGGCSFVTAGLSTSIYHTFVMYLPSVLMGLFYVAILIRTAIGFYRKTSETGPGNSSSKSAHTTALHRRFEISKMLFVSFLWFCVSSYPLTLALAFFQRHYTTNIGTQLVTRYLIASYSALNPVRRREITISKLSLTYRGQHRTEHCLSV
jgi:7 transmembrane receptor (rhodopsin family)